MKLKRDTKLGEELTRAFKIGIRNLTNFDLRENSKVSKIFNLMGSYWANFILFELKKNRGIIFYETEEGYKIWVGIDLPFIAWDKKVQRSYLSWHGRVMLNLKKDWLVAWKITWGILQIFSRTLESVKIGTLIGPFYPN